VAKSDKLMYDTAAKEMLMLATRDSDHHTDHELGLFKWRQETHLCRFSTPYSEKPYIVSIYKIASGLDPRLTRSLKSQAQMPVFRVHPRVEFLGRKYLLGVTGDQLILLSGEDIIYCLVHPKRGSDRTYRSGADGMDFGGRK
jgi:hypothetical protein